MSDDEFEPRAGRSRARGGSEGRRGASLVGQVIRRLRSGGLTPLGRRAGLRGSGRSGRGRNAGLVLGRGPPTRRVVVKARIVRHRGARYRAAPLARHVAYLERDGVSRDQTEPALFDATMERADGAGFADRCADDRHHFRFIVSPEDGLDMADLRAFTRELMADMARDLGTRLDWVAIDHWNTDNPHVHILLRGRGEDGADLVIDRGYISHGLRARAEQRVALELGPRSERDLARSQLREVAADRWTGLDRQLRSRADQQGRIDLRPDPAARDRRRQALLLARANRLAQLGLAEREGPGLWRLSDALEPALRELEARAEAGRSLAQALAALGREDEAVRLAVHPDAPGQAITGRLLVRGLHDELAGTAYALVEGIDGRIHHMRFADLEATGDAPCGAIVEWCADQSRSGQLYARLALCCDLPVGDQVTAEGATWLDRQLVARRPPVFGDGFGQVARAALAARADHLAGAGLAVREGVGLRFADNLLGRLRQAELDAAAARLGAETGRAVQLAAPGTPVAGTFNRRLDLASGRFALIDNGLGFQLVPWQPQLDRRLGQTVAGTVNTSGGVDWTIARNRSLSP